jgi:hypothetical protein
VNEPPDVAHEWGDLDDAEAGSVTCRRCGISTEPAILDTSKLNLVALGEAPFRAGALIPLQPCEPRLAASEGDSRVAAPPEIVAPEPTSEAGGEQLPTDCPICAPEPCDWTAGHREDAARRLTSLPLSVPFRLPDIIAEDQVQPMREAIKRVVDVAAALSRRRRVKPPCKSKPGANAARKKKRKAERKAERKARRRSR